MVVLFPDLAGVWRRTVDGDPVGRELFSKHYSRRRRRDGRRPRLFVGPGEKEVLVAHDGSALFVWRRFRDDSGELGVNCAVFRNEGGLRSSDLIRAAVVIAWSRWPGERLYTYVDGASVRSANPGYCFKAAGWRFVRRTPGGHGRRALDVLELLP
jgi:hypothetical protein